MVGTLRKSLQLAILAGTSAIVIALFAFVSSVSAQINPLPTPEPQPGSYGIEATKTQAPPTQGAQITTPGNGSSFTTSPITVSGICPTGLLVQIYNNGVMVGSAMCENGSFSFQVSLFAGTNELVAGVFDDIDQRGPDSNTVTVTYTNTQFSAFGELITLTTAYGRRSSPATTQLQWPLQLSGGTGPYAFSIDWGDGTPAELRSQALSGVVSIAHTYRNAGIYRVNVTATDVNGVSAFLQIVAVSSGQVAEGAGTEEQQGSGTLPAEVLWVPTIASAIALFPAFWLGRRSQMVTLHNKMLKERDNYQEK